MEGLNMSIWTLALLIAVALAFDFMNGFHDGANSISTIVATGALTPKQAVLFAAFFNFAACGCFSSRWRRRSARAPSTRVSSIIT
jgi:PiT family inorganic phosphate transporter